MKDIQSSEFSRALTDVRKAYRLLYGYQQRVLDLVKFIGDHWNLTFEGGYPWWTDGTPKGKNVKLDSSGWDWLMLYYYDFYFERKEKDQTLQLGIIIQSDTGYYDNETSDYNNVNAFEKPEVSETRIIFMASNGKWDSSEVRTKKFGKKKTVYPETDQTIHDEEVKVIAMAFKLEDLMNEESTKRVLEKFEQFCAEKGIKNLQQINLPN